MSAKSSSGSASGRQPRIARTGVQAREIGQLIAAGKVKPYIEATFPLEEAGIALQRLQQRHTQGKTVL